MCVAVPMQVIETQGLFGICEGRGERERVDMRLVGEQPVGTWVLVFHGAAREVVDPDRAREVTAALEALEATLRGETDVDHLFADLVNREPQLPEHLRKDRNNG
jgi:hydrogenase assembly chaperone HypC/HupF